MAVILMPLLLAAIIVVALCVIILLLLVSFNAKAARRINRLLVNLCTVIYGMSDQAPQRSFHRPAVQKDEGSKGGTL